MTERVIKYNTKVLGWLAKQDNTDRIGKLEAFMGLKLWQNIQKEMSNKYSRDVGGSPRREIRVRNEDPTGVWEEQGWDWPPTLT